KMRQNYFSDPATFINQAVDECVQFSLLLFVWRGRVDDYQLVAAYDVAIGVRRRGQRWRSHRKKKNTRMKLDSPNHPAFRLGNGVERRRQPIQSIKILCERSNYVKSGWRHNDLAALPSSVSFSSSDPFTRLKLASIDQSLLSFG